MRLSLSRPKFTLCGYGIAAAIGHCLRAESLVHNNITILRNINVQLLQAGRKPTNYYRPVYYNIIPIDAAARLLRSVDLTII